MYRNRLLFCHYQPNLSVSNVVFQGISKSFQVVRARFKKYSLVSIRFLLHLSYAAMWIMCKMWRMLLCGPASSFGVL